jgi:hypothetical protein
MKLKADEIMAQQPETDEANVRQWPVMCINPETKLLTMMT